MDVSGSKSLFVAPSSPVRRLCSNRSRLSRLRQSFVTRFMRLNIHFQLYNFITMDFFVKITGKTFLPLFYSFNISHDGKKKLLVDETFKMLFCKAAIRKARRSCRSSLSLTISMAISHVVYFKRGQKHWCF